MCCRGYKLIKKLYNNVNNLFPGKKVPMVGLQLILF